MHNPYDNSFYAAQAIDSLRSARAILPNLFERLKPSSVLDVGCGIAPWLRAASELGANELLGVDGDYVDRRTLMVDPKNFRPCDLAKGDIADVARDAGFASFDLAISVEVAEHVPHARSAGFVAELCQLSDVILFSAAIPFQGGTQHINEQWPEYWAIQFRREGFVAYDWLREAHWNDPEVDWWYAQNILVFVKMDSPSRVALPAEALRERGLLAKVHPCCWLSGVLNRITLHPESARLDEPADFFAVSRAQKAADTMLPVLRAVERGRLAPTQRRDVFPYTRLDYAGVDDIVTAMSEICALRRQFSSDSTKNEALNNRDWRDFPSLVNELRGAVESRFAAQSEEFDARIGALREEYAGHLDAKDRAINELAAKLHEIERNYRLLDDERRQLSSELVHLSHVEGELLAARKAHADQIQYFRQLHRSTSRLWRSLKYYVVFSGLKLASTATKPFSRRMSERLDRSAEKRSPRRLKKLYREAVAQSIAAGDGERK